MTLFAAGLQKTSLIDFPGKISCVVFLTGCNFTCPFCHNPDLALGRYPERIDMDRLSDFLAERKTLLDGVVITGGEPTLNPNLSDLCRMIRSHGLAVKLDTNGSRPSVISGLLADRLVDYVAMDVKTAPDAYGPPLCENAMADRIRRSIAVIKAHCPAYEFRTTCVAPFATPESIVRIAQSIRSAKQFTLQTYRSTTLLDPEFHSQEKDYTPEQMADLQKLAAPYVAACTVR